MKTLKINPRKTENFFSFVYPYNIVSEYFNLEVIKGSGSTCAFVMSENNTVLQAWVCDHDCGDFDSYEYELDENGCVTWTQLYDFLDSEIDAEDFNNHVKNCIDETTMNFFQSKREK